MYAILNIELIPVEIKPIKMSGINHRFGFNNTPKKERVLLNKDS